ncbi:MAG: 50S ribosomal protein L29 [Clostridiales bacterium]|jgi:large subunit ribosomal protein L29|nr:50S ribosomal protein L29 [Clostridiales bacterium]
MDLNSIRKMTDQEREAELARMKQELFNLRFQHVTGQLESPVRMREIKRDIARVKTIIRQDELNQPKA